MNNPEMINNTLGGYLSAVAEKYPDRQAVKYTNRDYDRTWSEFNKEAETIAKGFLSLGIGRGDHVAIWATNVPQWLLTLFACSKIGAVLVTVNTNYKVFEVEYLLRQSDTKAVVLIDGLKDCSYTGIINELCPMLKTSEPGHMNNPMLPFLKTVIYVGEDKENTKGMVNWNDLYELAKDVPDSVLKIIQKSIEPNDVTNIQYTSGTTGFPKGVMLTHYNILNNGRTIGDGMKFTPNDRLCICVPFFHCFGLVLSIMACLTHATTMVPVDVYSPLKVLSALQNEHCTAVHGVPTMFIAMLGKPEFPTFDLSSMRTGIMAGSPCPINIMRQVVEKMNMRDIVIVYGQTEASPGCTMTTTTDSLEKRVTTVGRHFPGVETKIVDPATGEDVGPGIQGEFCARGYNIMRGYYKMEEATKQVIDKDGWLHTGDLAMSDEEGYYKITGRIKDMIIRGGENIYPMEIEEFLYTVDGIKDVQIIGVPSEQYGEEICAFVIKKEGSDITEDDVKNAVRTHMARHKVPSYVIFVDEFLMNAAGKIQKFKMRELAVEKLGLQQADKIETA